MSTTVSPPVSKLLCVCKLRWVPKSNTDYMVIRNVEAMKELVKAVTATDPNAAAAAEAFAKKKLNDETEQYLAGQQITVPFAAATTYGMRDIGARQL